MALPGDVWVAMGTVVVALCGSISKIHSHPRSPVSLLCAGTLPCHSPVCPLNVTALGRRAESSPLGPACSSREGGDPEPLKCILNNKRGTNLMPSVIKVNEMSQGAAPGSLGAARTQIPWDFSPQNFPSAVCGREAHPAHGWHRALPAEAGLEMPLGTASVSLCPLRAGWAHGRALSQPKSICVRLGRRLEPAWMARRGNEDVQGRSQGQGRGAAGQRRQGQAGSLSHPTSRGRLFVTGHQGTVLSFCSGFGLAVGHARDPLQGWGAAEFQQLLRAGGSGSRSGSARAATSPDISSWNKARLPKPGCSAPI